MIGRWFRRRGLSCDEVMVVLQSYIDGETGVDTARAVAAHLADCPDCDLESTAYRKIKLSLASTAAPLDPEVMASLRNFSDRLVRGEIDGSTA